MYQSKQCYENLEQKKKKSNCFIFKTLGESYILVQTIVHPLNYQQNSRKKEKKLVKKKLESLMILHMNPPGCK